MDDLIFWISLFSQAVTLIMMVFFAIIIVVFRKDIMKRLRGNDEPNHLR